MSRTPHVQARAVRIDRYGGREVLSVRDVPMPAPGEGELLVQVRAAGINPWGGHDPLGRFARQATGHLP